MARPKNQNVRKTTTIRIWKTNHAALKVLCPEGMALEVYFNQMLETLLEYKNL